MSRKTTKTTLRVKALSRSYSPYGLLSRRLLKKWERYITYTGATIYPTTLTRHAMNEYIYQRRHGQEELLHSHTRNKRYTTRIPFRDSRWLWMSERVGEWVKNARMDVTGGIWCHWKFTPILGGSSFFPTNDAWLVIVVTTNIATTTYTTLNFTHSNPVRFLWDTIAVEAAVAAADAR